MVGGANHQSRWCAGFRQKAAEPAVTATVTVDDAKARDANAADFKSKNGKGRIMSTADIRNDTVAVTSDEVVETENVAAWRRLRRATA